jgi:phosphoribosylformylglycinamidine (FGAM) synthase-like enzyme
MYEPLDIASMSDDEIQNIQADNKIGLTVKEIRKVQEILKRPPTRTELIIWDIQGSEHCSYRSTRKYIKDLPTEAPNVILGVGEDAGIVEIANDGKDRWGIAVSHESHNHPSQVVPYEGAATGVGGNVRDIACMGAKVIATLDPLRFGNIENDACRIIAQQVVEGIGGYGNPLGIPNLGGSATFNESFNDNCLVNVISVGLIKESDIIHSYCPKEAAEEEWDIIIVGKPTDTSGMGGASFASLTLNEEDKEKNKGAVQEPNPFLKRHLLHASYDLFKILKNKKAISRTSKDNSQITGDSVSQVKKESPDTKTHPLVSFKDMGAGGNTCSTVEQVLHWGLGAEIDLKKVHVATPDLHPSVIAASETQERFAWMFHPSLTRLIVDHYNTTWDLPSVAENAKASVVGKVKEGNFVLKYGDKVVLDATASQICEGLRYEREHKANPTKLSEPNLEVLLRRNLNEDSDAKTPSNALKTSTQKPYQSRMHSKNAPAEAEEENSGTPTIPSKKESVTSSFGASTTTTINKLIPTLILKTLSNENIANSEPIYERYDKTVQGITVIDRGLADAGVIAPLIDEDSPINTIGVALSEAGNPRYGAISAYHQATNAVAQAMRKCAAVGALPIGLTDCLNYGNPEKPKPMQDIIDGIKGLKDAASAIHLHPGLSSRTNDEGESESISLHTDPPKQESFPTPFLAGNASLYNESSNGTSINPSAIVGCFGKMNNHSKSITNQLKQADSIVVLIGERKNELGGSILYHQLGELGANVPKINDFTEVKNQIYTVTEAIEKELILAAKVIDQGGLIIALCEMTMKTDTGLEIDLSQVPNQNLSTLTILFSETGGFVLEIDRSKLTDFKNLCKTHNIAPYIIGKTTADPTIKLSNTHTEICTLKLKNTKHAWQTGLREKLYE